MGMSVLGMIQSTVGGFGTFAGFGLGVTAAKHVAESRRSEPARAVRIIVLSSIVAIVTGASWGGLIGAVWQSEESSAGISLDPILFSNHNADPRQSRPSRCPPAKRPDFVDVTPVPLGFLNPTRKPAAVSQ